MVKDYISLGIAVVALLFTAFSYRRTAYKDNGETATRQAMMSADIKYIRNSVDEIKLENRALREDVSKLQSKVTEVEQIAKSAHKRLDDLKGGHSNE